VSTAIELTPGAHFMAWLDHTESEQRRAGLTAWANLIADQVFDDVLAADVMLRELVHWVPARMLCLGMSRWFDRLRDRARLRIVLHEDRRE
jgi:hypothetical protein